MQLYDTDCSLYCWILVFPMRAWRMPEKTQCCQKPVQDHKEYSVMERRFFYLWYLSFCLGEGASEPYNVFFPSDQYWMYPKLWLIQEIMTRQWHRLCFCFFLAFFLRYFRRLDAVDSHTDCVVRMVTGPGTLLFMRSDEVTAWIPLAALCRWHTILIKLKFTGLELFTLNLTIFLKKKKVNNAVICL